MRAFLKGHAFFTGMALSLLLLSILCRFITGVLLKKLIKEAENMSATDNRLLKQCKLKFQNCYELNAGAVNVEVFVGKFMHNIRIGKCSLRLIGQFSGQFLLLSVFADGIGACLGLVHGETLGEVLPYYLIAFLSLYLYFSISGLIDVPGKKEALETTITDFLENRMSERMKSVKRDSDYLDAAEKEAEKRAQEEIWKKAQDGPFVQPACDSRMHKERQDERRSKEGEKDKEELEALLTEFLA